MPLKFPNSIQKSFRSAESLTLPQSAPLLHHLLPHISASHCNSSTLVCSTRSEVFKGLCNDERLAIVFMALFDGLVAEAGKNDATLNATTTSQRSGLSRSACSERGRGLKHDKYPIEVDDPSKTAAASGSPTLRKRNGSTVNLSRSNSSFPEGVFSIDADVATENSGEGGVGTYTDDAVRAGVKASFIGANVRALPVWGGLGLIAGTSLLVECRTPAQWQPQKFRPTGQVLA